MCVRSSSIEDRTQRKQLFAVWRPGLGVSAVSLSALYSECYRGGKPLPRNLINFTKTIRPLQTVLNGHEKK